RRAHQVARQQECDQHRTGDGGGAEGSAASRGDRRPTRAADRRGGSRRDAAGACRTGGVTAMAQLTITQRKSLIGATPKASASVRSLGLKRIHHSVTHDDTPHVRGYLHAARHLVTVAESTGGATRKKATSK